MNRRINKVAVIFIVAVLASFMILFVSCNSNKQNVVTEHDIEVPILYDKPAKYVFDEKQDLQMPELPTGCEATALGTLLRMNGVNVTKFDVADAMPKSNGSDFVYSFWGNPYSATDGWACMAPCSVITANKFLKDAGKAGLYGHVVPALRGRRIREKQDIPSENIVIGRNAYQAGHAHRLDKMAA